MFHNAYGRQEIGADKFRRFIAVQPPKLGPSKDLMRPLEPTLYELLDIDRRIYAPSPVRSFGLEARVAHFLTETASVRPELNPRQLLIRPAPEPIVFSYWERFTQWSMDDDAFISLASCLCGRELGYRTAMGATLPNTEGVSTLYPEPSIAARWLERISPPQNMNILEGFSEALLAYVSMTTDHPFTDGNGRVGRAIFQGVLARTVGLSSPMLALGAFSYLHKYELKSGMVQIGTEGDWTNFIKTFHVILKSCVEYHHEMYN